MKKKERERERERENNDGAIEIFRIRLIQRENEREERRVRHRDELSLLTISHFLPIIIISRSMPLLFFIAILIFPLFSPSLPISLSQPHFVYLKHMHAFLSVISLYLHLSSFFPTLPFFFPYFPITVHPSLVPSFIPAFVPSFVPSVVPSFFPSFLPSFPRSFFPYLIHSSTHPSIPFLPFLFSTIFSSSYQCMEATPSLACANKCVFCWRHHKNPVGTEWRYGNL